MGENYARWETDPLFSAAEVVQDSADRMESVYRSLLHEEKLVQNQNSNIISSINYHKRDLATTLETTRWQLEDFARAVDFATLSDNSNSRKIAISKFNQFIQAIRAQIVQVENNLNNSNLEESTQNSKISNEQDSDNLASFLASNNNINYNNNYNNNNIEEIIEIKEEILDNNGFESTSNDLEIGNNNNYEAKCYPKNNNGVIIIKPSFNFLRKFWFSNNRESFTKRQKDGEILTNDDVNISPLINNNPIVEKYRIPLASVVFMLCLLVFLIKVV